MEFSRFGILMSEGGHHGDAPELFDAGGEAKFVCIWHGHFITLGVGPGGVARRSRGRKYRCRRRSPRKNYQKWTASGIRTSSDWPSDDRRWGNNHGSVSAHSRWPAGSTSWRDTLGHTNDWEARQG